MIKIDHLTKIFSSGAEKVTALEDVSLTVARGDIFGIIGMSGAGKSTLLRCLAMLETPTDGTVEIAGADTRTLKGKDLIAARRNMGVVFQGYNLLMQKMCTTMWRFRLRLQKPRKSSRMHA